VFEIVGVMPRSFRGLTVSPPDYWAPLAVLTRLRPADSGFEASTAVGIVGRLKPGMSPRTAQAGLAVWAANLPHGAPTDREALALTLVPRRGTVSQPREAVLVTGPLFVAFGLILLIGCANVANLLLARAVARQREIGIRLSLGAARGRIVRQLLTESLLLALLAAAAGFAISRVLLHAIVGTVLAGMPPDIGDIRLQVPAADWRVALFLGAGAAVSTVFFGLLPALHATRADPLRTIRGEAVKDARPGRARDVLIGIQVSASALLLISAAVFLSSALRTVTHDPGMRTSDTIVAGITDEAHRAATVQALRAEPLVAAVAAAWPAAISAPRPALAEAAGAKATVAFRFVSPEYFSVLDIALVQGRGFTPAERMPDLPLAVVSETAAQVLWPHAAAIGQAIRIAADPRSPAAAAHEPRLAPRTATVIGVVRDVPGFRIAPADRAIVYVPASSDVRGTALVARVHGDPEAARQKLLDRMARTDPHMGEVVTLRWVSRMERYFLYLAFWFTVVLGGLALALTLSGLFSVLSYLVEQRTREIGVRIALGATALDVAHLVVSQTMRPVGMGLCLGAGAAAALSAVLLSTSGAAAIGELIHVFDPAAYAASLFIIVVACLAAASIPAARAARLDPALTLRQE
jgi:predicted permease